MDTPLSAKEFLKVRRPESFSDSEIVSTPILDRSMFEYHLDTITSRSDELRFETFARELAKREICPNILPHTGPTGGGDSKVDAETYPVADGLSLTWCVGAGRDAASERWAFAFSAMKTWRAKVRSDVGKIAKSGRGYAKAFFITNQFVKDKARAEVEDALRTKHKLDVRILDRNWILDRVFAGHHEQLAIEHLGIQVSAREEIKRGPLDTERQRELTEIEARIAAATRDNRFTFQVVEDCIGAARLARNMERPRTEIDGLLARAERVAKEHGTPHQQLLAAYERAKTAYWYFEDAKTFVEAYPIVEALAQGSVNAYDLELLSNLWFLLRTAVAQNSLDASTVDFAGKTARLTVELERLTAETTRPSAALQARTILLHHRLIDGPPEERDAVLDKLRDVIGESEGLAGYPLKSYVQIIQELGPVFADCPAYERLFDTVVEIISKHDGDIAAARLLCAHGGQHLMAGRNYEAIRILGRALSRLYKQESREDLIRALLLCGMAYEHVGLLWAARGTTLTAAALATDKFYKHSTIDELQARGYWRLKWLELQLGRIPHILTWQQLDLLARASLNELAEEPDEEDINFNAILGMLLLRASIPQLQQLTTLPDVLDALRLPMASLALLYALGHEDELPDDLGGERPIEFFRRWLEQPVAKSIPERPELYDGEAATLTSRIAGCRLTITTSTATPCVDIAESILAAIESLVSTAMIDGAIACEPEMTMHVALSDSDTPLLSFALVEREGRPHMDVRCASFHSQKMPLDDQHNVRSTISDLLMHVFARTFLISNFEETLTKLFRDEQAIDRAVNFTSSLVVTGNILGDKPTTTLAPWQAQGRNFALRREQAWTASLPAAANDVQSSTPPKFGVGDPPPEVEDRARLRHTDIENVSLIRLALWDRAQWWATAFSVSPRAADAPVLALVFEDREAAAAIFAALRKDVGQIDEKERLRVSILRGVDRHNPYAYTVVIGTNVPSTKLSPDKLVLMVSRFHTMHPDSDVNLKSFLAAYGTTGGYFFMPAVRNGAGIEFIDDDYIAKRELNIRDAWQIGRHDPDALAIRDDDEPLIPEGETNPPIMDLLKARRARASNG
jgi:hypothetical protein